MQAPQADRSFAGTTQISSTQVDHLSCSPHNDVLLLTGDTDEINFWDIRSLSKALYSIKCGQAYQMEFSLWSSNFVWVSRETSVEAVSIADCKINEPIDNSGIKFSYGGHAFGRINFEQHPNLVDLFISKDSKSNVMQVWQPGSGMYVK